MTQVPVFHCDSPLKMGQDEDGTYFIDDNRTSPTYGDYVNQCPKCEVELYQDIVSHESSWVDIELLSRRLREKEAEFQEQFAHLQPLKEEIAMIAKTIKSIVLDMGESYEDEHIKCGFVRASTSTTYDKKTLLKLAKTNREIAECITVKPKKAYVTGPKLK